MKQVSLKKDGTIKKYYQVLKILPAKLKLAGFFCLYQVVIRCFAEPFTYRKIDEDPQNLYLRDKSEPVSANVEARAFTFKSCELDDIYIFRPDNVFMRKDSLVTCDPRDS